jgi:hypothetical protein
MSSDLTRRVNRLTIWSGGGPRVSQILRRCQAERGRDDIGDDGWFFEAIAKVSDRELDVLISVIGGWDAGVENGDPVPPC